MTRAVVVDDVKQLDGLTRGADRRGRRRGQGARPGRQVRAHAAQHHRPAAGIAADVPAAAPAPVRGVHRARQPRRQVRQHRDWSAASSSCAPSRPTLLGFANHAAYKLEDQTAKTPQAVNAHAAPAGAGRGGQREARGGRPAGGDRPRRRRLQARGLGLGFLQRKGARGRSTPSTNRSSSPTSNCGTCWRTACSTPRTCCTA